MRFPNAVMSVAAVLGVISLLPYGWLWFQDFGISPVCGALLSLLLGVCIGGGLYRSYKCVAAKMEPSRKKDAFWWCSLIVSGIIAFYACVGIESLYNTIKHVSEPVDIFRCAFAGFVGIAFGAGFGQGEKLM